MRDQEKNVGLAIVFGTFAVLTFAAFKVGRKVGMLETANQAKQTLIEILQTSEEK